MHSKHHTNKLKDWVTLTRRTIGYDWLFGDVFCVISGEETPAAGSEGYSDNKLCFSPCVVLS